MLKKITTYPVDYNFNEDNKYELTFITMTKDGGNVAKVVECDIFTLQKIIKSTNAIIVSVKLVQQHKKFQDKKSNPMFTFI